MYVIKRDGSRAPVLFQEIQQRLEGLRGNLAVDVGLVTQKVIAGLVPGIRTSELDAVAAKECSDLITVKPDYGYFAARIAASNLQKLTDKTYSQAVARLYAHTQPRTKKHAPRVSEELYQFVQRHAAVLDAMVEPARDMLYTYFGMVTLMHSYLLRTNDQIAETPQYFHLRVACGLHMHLPSDVALPLIKESYEVFSQHLMTQASPTLFNAGTPRPSLASCILMALKDDSIEGIYDTIGDAARASKSAAGLGVHIHNVRAKGTEISTTGGHSNGIVPMIKVFNETARYVDQGGNKRPGAFAFYLEPWHADIFDFVNLRRSRGPESARARDVYMGLWIPDLFMRRVEANQTWSLFSPNEAPGLADVYGDMFDALYQRYEKEGRAMRQVPAQQLWLEILDAQTETGMPYMLFKDACNRNSNQRNLGTIKSSNLCTLLFWVNGYREIIEYSSPEETAVCNLASLALPQYVRQPYTDKAWFDHLEFARVVRIATRNLNHAIDVMHYPTEAAQRSNVRHRPIGLGVQGLADCFAMMRMPFGSVEAKTLDREIFETMYYAALDQSCTMAEHLGAYPSYFQNGGSPISLGILHFDRFPQTQLSGRWDWASLRQRIARHGVRNSLLVAPMPTASTAQILGNNESIEALASNCYARRVLSGLFVVPNHHLVRDLMERDIYTPELMQLIIAHDGSVQPIPEIPDDLKRLYRTVWEIPQRLVIEHAAERLPFVDQSMSLNIHMAEPTAAKLDACHRKAWHSGLKTGMYYLRTRAKTAALPALPAHILALAQRQRTQTPTNIFGLPASLVRQAASADNTEETDEAEACRRDNAEACMACSS